MRFMEACTRVTGTERSRQGIGTLGEKTLHATLKLYLEPCTQNHEIKIGRFVADIQNNQGITEIQTRGFHAMKAKLTAFLELCPVRVVYPIAKTKWLVWMDQETGELSPRRKSPRKGKPWDIFYELAWIKPYLTHPNFQLHVVLVDMVEYRNLNGWSHDKKRGSSRYERIPVELIEEITVNKLEDYQKLLPPSLPHVCTSKDFQKAAGGTLRSAQTALNVLCVVGAVQQTGKTGRLNTYTKKL